jgi:predicted PurR-regulated permease PerM
VQIQNPFRVGLIGTLGVGLGLLIITATTSLATVLTYIGAALFLALGLDPAVNWLVRKRFPRWAAIITVVAVVVLVFAGVVLAIVPVIVQQSVGFFKTLPETIDAMRTSAWAQWIHQQAGSSFDIDNLLKQLSAFLTDPKNLASIAGGVLAVGVGVANGVTGTLIVLILTLYFTASLQPIKQTAYRLVPRSKREKFIELSEQITGGVGKYVMGQIALAALNGVLTFIMLSIIGGKAAVVFAFIAFLFALIPLIGTVMASAIVVIGQLMLTDPTIALIAGIYFLIYMQIEAYVLSPRIMNRAISIPGSIVVIAALAGGTLMGVLGALVAIPIAASIVLVVQEVVMPKQELV